MTNLIQIGAGNKKFDRLGLLFNLAIFIVALVMSFYQIYALFFLLIFSISNLINLIRLMQYRYVFLEGDYFAIDSLFESKNKTRVKTDLYNGLSRSYLEIPFSNSMIIHFKNGEKYRIMGGMNKMADLDLEIRNQIRNIAD